MYALFDWYRTLYNLHIGGIARDEIYIRKFIFAVIEIKGVNSGILW